MNEKKLYKDIENALKGKESIDCIDYSPRESSASIDLYDVGPNGEDEFFKEVKKLYEELENNGYIIKLLRFGECENKYGEKVSAEARMFFKW